jgi:hypothetical protein
VAVDSVDNSPSFVSCPHCPQPYYCGLFKSADRSRRITINTGQHGTTFGVKPHSYPGCNRHRWCTATFRFVPAHSRQHVNLFFGGCATERACWSFKGWWEWYEVFLASPRRTGITKYWRFTRTDPYNIAGPGMNYPVARTVQTCSVSARILEHCGIGHSIHVCVSSERIALLAFPCILLSEPTTFRLVVPRSEEDELTVSLPPLPGEIPGLAADLMRVVELAMLRYGS